MNLLEANLQSRTPEATWRSVGVGVAPGYIAGNIRVGRDDARWYGAICR